MVWWEAVVRHWPTRAALRTRGGKTTVSATAGSARSACIVARRRRRGRDDAGRRRGSGRGASHRGGRWVSSLPAVARWSWQSVPLPLAWSPELGDGLVHESRGHHVLGLGGVSRWRGAAVHDDNHAKGADTQCVAYLTWPSADRAATSNSRPRSRPLRPRTAWERRRRRATCCTRISPLRKGGWFAEPHPPEERQCLIEP